MTRSEDILIRIDPGTIESCFVRRDRLAKLRFLANRALPPRQVHVGGWDQRVFPIDRHRTYRLMAAVVQHGEDLDALRKTLERTAHLPGIQGTRHHLKPDFEAYIAECLALARRLREEGYRLDAATDHIGVAIGRDGSLIKVAQGHHRLALARVLPLASVVANVQFVHKRWFREHGGKIRGDVPAQIRAMLREDGFEVLQPG
ncbi:hypothetical protein H0Z60_11635 [Ectothiorhodospiraceae bacterium WFHF3C12]|nr:hypothetical protein [Ectothiorhodospiraceae bacterium WFHF3C12]